MRPDRYVPEIGTVFYLPAQARANGRTYTIRWKVVGYAARHGRNRHVTVFSDPRGLRFVVLERLDDGSRTDPKGTLWAMALHAVQSSVHAGRWKIERQHEASPVGVDDYARRRLPDPVQAVINSAEVRALIAGGEWNWRDLVRTAIAVYERQNDR